MRFISLVVRNYRIHQDTRIDFDASRHLIGGINETGKSTIAEAIHRVLFMRYKAGGEIQKSMVSGIHSGHPEVALVFEAAGETWTIEKTFAGPARSTARLTSTRGISLQGDEAEEKLAEITSNPDGPANRETEINTRWAHLWVWQGKSGEDASTHAAGHRSELTQRLQESGLASVMQSAADEKTREAVCALHDAIFTKTGVKTGSRLDLATKALKIANDQLAEATAQKARLEDAVKDQEAAANDLQDAEAALPNLRTQLATHQNTLTQARDLRVEVDKQTLLHTQAENTLKDRTDADGQILRLQSEIESDQKSLDPEEKKLADLAGQATTASEKADAARRVANASSEDLRKTRRRHDLATACVRKFETAEALEGLRRKKKEIDEVKESLKVHEKDFAHLPSVSEKQLKDLRKSESELSQAQSALDAIATGVELVASPQSVSLNGQPLKPTERQVVTEASEISLPDGTRLRILPGGGTSLAEARSKVEERAKKVADLLSRLALPDSTHAAEIFAKRQALENKIEITQSRLKDLGADALPAKLSEAEKANDAAMAEVNRWQGDLSSDQSPAILPLTLDDSRAWEKATRLSLQTQEDQDKKWVAEANAALKDSQTKATAHQTASKEVQKSRDELKEKKGKASVLEEIHGDARKRAADIEVAKEEEKKVKEARAKVESALADLDPERQERELSRLTKVIEQQEENKQDARERLAAAKTVLASEGTCDPGADLLKAKARLATASEEHAREKRHADAIALLHRLFTESRESITRSVTQPIADRVTGYLECLFGRGVRVEVDWSESEDKQTIHLQHPGMPRFAFKSLSGGAKEQVAAAVRLATAEILAAAHNGCLPILFDDSFAYSDRDRIQSLQSMLDLAASRGLQVIVLSCTPADYIGFGATATALKKPQFTGKMPSGDIDRSSIEPETAEGLASVSVDPHRAEQFLSTLREAGGKSGNVSLQTTLGWDDMTYTAVKDSLVRSGQISRGQGRGGSVSIL